MEQQAIQAIIDRVKTIKRIDLVRDTESSVEFTRLYEELFKEKAPCSTCTNALLNAYDRIINLNSNQIFVMANSNNYKLRNENDVLDLTFQPIKGVPVHVTKANLTDEIAKTIIAANANYKKRFVVKEGAATGDAVAGKTAAKATTAAADKAAKDKADGSQESNGDAALEALMNDNTKATLIEQLTAKNIQHDPKSTKEELAKLLLNA